MKISWKRIECWVPKAANRHSEYVIIIDFKLQKWLHERASVLRYTYIACLVIRTSSVSLYVHRLSRYTYIASLVIRTSPVSLYVHRLSRYTYIACLVIK